MIAVQYKSSKGQTIDLITANGLVKMTDANFHSWKYSFDTTDMQYGVRVNKPKRSEAEYEAKIYIYGQGNQAKQKLNEMQDIFETDILLNQTGKMIWGDWSIDCFISESDTEPLEDVFGVQKSITIYCPEPFWTKETGRAFEKISVEANGLNFPFNFPFNLGIGQATSQRWNTGINVPSDFILTFNGNSSGTVTNPTVNIAGHEYKVFTNIESGQMVTINSRTNEVLKYLSNGTVVNIFNSRNFAQSVFEKIPGGEIAINWSGTFTFSLTLLEKRSEPRWTLS